jgi:hypothetical protein
MQVFVLGMHRSGTSSVTRLLNMAGAYFGPEGISNGADEGNLKGFWERVDVRAACDGLLQESGFDWWKVAGFTLDRVPEPVRARHVRTLSRIILELDAHRPWVVKEPRLSLLFPLIQPLLELPVCVHVTREPLEVAQSLETRNGFPAPAGLALWELYTIRAFEASAGLPRVLVHYEDLMSAPVDTFARLLCQLEDLGVVGLRVPREREIAAYIDPDLHREHGSSNDRGMWMNEQQLSLAAAIDDSTVTDDGAIPHEVSEGASAQLRAFEDDCARRARADQLQNEVDQLQNQIKRLYDRSDATGALLDRAGRQLHALAGSRTWRFAWGTNVASRRLRWLDPEGASEPVERALSIIDRARHELGDPAPSAVTAETEDQPDDADGRGS